MATITIEREEFLRRCRAVYERNKQLLESKHDGKIVALYEDGVAAIGDTSNDAYREAKTKHPDKVFYLRRIGKFSAAGILFQVLDMRIPYKDNLPVAPIKIHGKTSMQMDAHIDFASAVTIVPKHIADELELGFASFEDTATGGGVISMPEYEASVEAFGGLHSIRVGCLDLPKESPIKALIGRDILDKYRVCLNGKTREIEVSDP